MFCYQKTTQRYAKILDLKASDVWGIPEQSLKNWPDKKAQNNMYKIQ